MLLIYNHQVQQYKLGNKYPLIQEGDKIKFVKLVEPNPFKFDVISYITKLPKEFKLDNYIDHDTMFQKTFLDPLSFILNSIGWSYEKKASRSFLWIIIFIIDYLHWSFAR